MPCHNQVGNAQKYIPKNPFMISLLIQKFWLETLQINFWSSQSNLSQDLHWENVLKLSKNKQMARDAKVAPQARALPSLLPLQIVALLGGNVNLTGRDHMTVWRSRDGGGSWEIRELVDPGAAGYSSLQPAGGARPAANTTADEDDE